MLEQRPTGEVQQPEHLVRRELVEPALGSVEGDAADDPRLRYAAERAANGRIAQYLAGAPELVTRYRAAPPAARAIIEVAIDARRLGHPPALPYALLEQAAVAVPGGRLVSTSLLNVLILDDGRILAGSVPLARLQAAATPR